MSDEVSPDVALARSYDDGEREPGYEERTISERCEIIKTKMEQRKHSRPLCYVAILPSLIEVARRNGYALCVHGSLVRDLDLVAVPWTDAATDAESLVAALAHVCGGVFSSGDTGMTPTQKPHGRLAWNIHTGAEMYLDLSVMPLRSR